MQPARTPRRTALVIGGSGGLGSLVVSRLLADGWRVFATMRSPERRARLDEVVAAAGADPSELTVVGFDLRVVGSIEQAVVAAQGCAAYSLDAVVACAGVLVAGPFEEVPAEVTRHVMEVNYFGLVETVRVALPALRAAHGRIVVMSSDSGFCGTAGLASYTASKFALEGWAESLALELDPLGVRLSIIEAGPFRSGIYGATDLYGTGGDSPYARLSDINRRALDELATSAPDAGPVVAAVAQALSARRPRLRYVIGREAKILSVCKRLFPERIFRLIARKLTGTAGW
jgi:NAD(P)-dependent dehydrogenase (short-subunit alcohol dehydrogenase family)